VRVLHFCNYADRVGGAEVYAHALIEALRSRGHEVALFGASPRGERDEPSLRVVERPVFEPQRLVRDAPVLEALTEFVQRFRPDVVHVHNLFSVALEVVEALGGIGRPIVHTVHDFQLLCPNSWCIRGDGAVCPGGAGAQCFQHRCQENYPYDAWSVLLAAVRQQLASRAASIAIAPSEYLAERLTAHGWRSVRQIPYFIDFVPVPEIPRGTADLLYVGRLEREKGVRVVLDALPEVIRAFPEARLTVLGTGSQERDLREHVKRLVLEPAVRFLSHVPREELPAHYARATACLLPSLWTENSPLVAYECLAAGLPMIGSRRGGIPELIEPDCGLTFEANSPADLARAVLSFLGLSAEQRNRMSVSGRIRSRRHGKAEHLDAIERTYRDAADLPMASAPARYSELLPVIAQLEAERRHAPTAAAVTFVRDLARKLGLPKVLPR
jgi:glycosyltransferase involved in cell wall biosynthesis